MYAANLILSETRLSFILPLILPFFVRLSRLVSTYNPNDDTHRWIDAPLGMNNSGLAAGMAIGIVGDAGVRAVGQQERLFVGMILILIFAEALGLYGMIVALILSQQSYSCE